MSRRLQVLFVEDSEQDTALALRELERSGFEVEWHRVDDQPSLERALDERRWDVILADHSMPSFDALRALETVRARDAEVPYVIISGIPGEELAVSAMRAGAQDYISKDRLVRLGAVIERELGEARMRAGRRRALAAQRETEARKAAILEASLDAVITMDHQGRIVEFNPAAERIFGHPASTVLGRELAEVIVPHHLRAAHRDGLARYLATGQGAIIGRRVELPAVRRDRSIFPVEVTVVRIDRPGPPLFTGFIRDVTDRHRLETRQQLLADAGVRLIESMDRAAMLQGVAELVVDHIAHWCAFELVERSGALERVAVAARQDRALADPSELDPGLSRKVIAARRPRRGTAGTDGGMLSYLAVPLLARGVALGTMILARDSCARSYDDDDQSLAVELAARCASAVENAALFEEVQASVRARDEFIAVAAHELRTPLTPLRLQAQALAAQLDRGGSAPPSRGRLEVPIRQIVRSTERLTTLVETLLDISRVTVGRFRLEREPMDLGQLTAEITDALGDQLASSRSPVVWTSPPPPAAGIWDRRRLTLAIRGVLDNAIKFGSGQPVELSIAVDAGTVRLAVRDHGPGFDSDQQAHLMDRFYRSAPIQHHSGFGVGLWLVRRVLEEHGGHVEVWSEPGDGACFTLVLPAGPVQRASQSPGVNP